MNDQEKMERFIRVCDEKGLVPEELIDDLNRRDVIVEMLPKLAVLVTPALFADLVNNLGDHSTLEQVQDISAYLNICLEEGRNRGVIALNIAADVAACVDIKRGDKLKTLRCAGWRNRVNN